MDRNQSFEKGGKSRGYKMPTSAIEYYKQYEKGEERWSEEDDTVFERRKQRLLQRVDWLI